MDNWLNINMALTPTLHNVKLVIKEKFYLPSVLVEVGDLRGCQFECVGKEHELTALLLIEEPHKPQMFGISFPTVRESQLYLGISQYPIG